MSTAQEWVENIAREFHARYEHLAPDHGYETRPESAVTWAAVPENNRRLMIATALAVVTAPGVILCWAQPDDGRTIACDRSSLHDGKHSWEL